MKNEELMKLAYEARQGSYSPYSHFAVGAALLCEDGTVFTGCNVENASFTPTCCAERVAFFKAVSEGKKRFSKIAIVGAPIGQNPDRLIMPCGVCRQVMLEFCGDEFEILATDGKEISVYCLGDIMPGAFRLETV